MSAQSALAHMLDGFKSRWMTPQACKYLQRTSSGRAQARRSDSCKSPQAAQHLNQNVLRRSKNVRECAQKLRRWRWCRHWRT